MKWMAIIAYGVVAGVVVGAVLQWLGLESDFAIGAIVGGLVGGTVHFFAKRGGPDAGASTPPARGNHH